MTTIKKLQEMTIKELEDYRDSLDINDWEFTIYVINHIIEDKRNHTQTLRKEKINNESK